MAFPLVDRVGTLVDGHQIVAFKNVSAADPFFPGHFPGYPVMPGVLICDAFAQAAALLLRSCPEVTRDAAVVVTALDHVRFRRPVVPGDRLELDVTLTRSQPPRWFVHGIGRVDGTVVAEADLVLTVGEGAVHDG